MSKQQFTKVSEIWAALLDGKKIACSRYEGYFLLKAGDIRNSICDLESGFICDTFSRAHEWSVYEEPKWYDDIPEQGVLCWAGNSESMLNAHGLASIIRRKEGIWYCSAGDYWQHAVPLTPEEAEKLIYKAQK
jgi:hypothetical protein